MKRFKLENINYNVSCAMCNDRPCLLVVSVCEDSGEINEYLVYNWEIHWLENLGNFEEMVCQGDWSEIYDDDIITVWDFEMGEHGTPIDTFIRKYVW